MNNISHNVLLDSFCLCILLLLIIINIKSLYPENKKTSNNFFPFWLFITFFSLCYRPLNSDFWFSLEDFEAGDNLYKEHMEPIFVWLKNILNYNYLLWRLVVWGTASFIMCLIFKKIKIKPNLATFVFLSVALLPCFYYLRNSLGFCILYYALVVYLMTKNRNLGCVLLVLFSFISWFFHRSMPLYIFISFMALLLPMKKQIIIISLILFPILYKLITSIAQELLILEVWSDDGGDKYLEAENTMNINMIGYILMIIRYIPYFYIMYMFCKHYDNYNYTNSLNIQKTFFFVAYSLIYLSFLFHGQASLNLAMRFWNTAMLPMSIFIASYINDHKGNKICRVFYLLMLFSFSCDTLISLF